MVGVGWGGGLGGALAFGWWMEKEGGRERGHKEYKPSGLSAPAVELSILMRPPLQPCDQRSKG